MIVEVGRTQKHPRVHSTCQPPLLAQERCAPALGAGRTYLAACLLGFRPRWLAITDPRYKGPAVSTGAMRVWKQSIGPELVCLHL